MLRIGGVTSTRASGGLRRMMRGMMGRRENVNDHVIMGVATCL